MFKFNLYDILKDNITGYQGVCLGRSDYFTGCRHYGLVAQKLNKDGKPQENAVFTCECSAEEIIFLPCSGGSNCGQITNQVAIKLDEEGAGHIYCLAGIAAHINSMVESARGAKMLVALDGCQVACAKKAIEHAGLKVTHWICVTDEGFAKTHQFKLTSEDIDLIARHTRESLAKSSGEK